jgi:diguanylate cyclase (GGDEF)-like protein
MVSWFGRKRMGVLISLASAFTWFIADFANGRIYTQPIIYLWNTLIRLGFFIIVTLLLSALKRTLKEEQELARTDFLTHTVNTRYFYDLGQLEINRSIRYHLPFTMVYIDLDNFKLINDRYGHSTGDLVLQKVAKIIQDNIRNTDQVGRLGGDEFAVLLSQIGTEWVHQIVDRILQALNVEMVTNNWTVTFSIGVAIFNSPPPTMDEVLKIADDEMYKIKSNHKNGVSYIEL